MKQFILIFIAILVGRIIATGLKLDTMWAYYFGAIVGATVLQILHEINKD